MKTIPTIKRIAAAAAVLICAVPLARSAKKTAARLKAAPESMLWLIGDSTLHPYQSRTSQFQLTAPLDPGLAASLATDLFNAIVQRQAVKGLDLVIPVKGLQSKESALDKNMYKALKAEACPTIEFRMSGYEVRASTAPTSPAKPVRATGVLRVACQEKPVTLEGTLSSESGGMRVQGEHALLMSDYGVKPPKMMMGAIKVRDKVVIHYDLHLQAE